MATRSLFNESQAPRRKRRFTPKVRTGCQTCKYVLIPIVPFYLHNDLFTVFRIRRVKCDEQRPSCNRCLSTGRTCDGYEALRLAQPSSQNNETTSLKWVHSSPMATPSLLPPQSTAPEQSAFYTFRVDLLEALAGPFEAGVWTHQVLPLSHSEPAVWHAVVALGSLGRTRGDGADRADREFAMQHYSQAMKTLQNQLAGPGNVPQHLALLVCLLFVTFELQQQAYGEAHSHLNGGLNIIQEYERSLEQESALSKESMDPLIEAFERLDVHIASFTSRKVCLKRSGRATTPTSTTDTPVQFAGVSDAMRELNFILGAMRDLDTEVQGQRFLSRKSSAELMVSFQIHVMGLLKRLREWDASMTSIEGDLSDRDSVAAKILRVREIYCRLKVSNCLNDGYECLWDSYLDDFERLVGLCEGVVPGLRMIGPTAKVTKTFTLDTGVIPTLYFTVLKCRDPHLRRKALALLEGCKHQEGAWNGPLIAHCAEKVVKVEERDIKNICSAADVPEENRLYQAHYDLRHSDSLLYCRRRRFETDGAWLEYSMSLG